MLWPINAVALYCIDIVGAASAGLAAGQRLFGISSSWRYQPASAIIGGGNIWRHPGIGWRRNPVAGGQCWQSSAHHQYGVLYQRQCCIGPANRSIFDRLYLCCGLSWPNQLWLAGESWRQCCIWPALPVTWLYHLGNTVSAAIGQLFGWLSSSISPASNVIHRSSWLAGWPINGPVLSTSGNVPLYLRLALRQLSSNQLAFVSAMLVVVIGYIYLFLRPGIVGVPLFGD